MKAHNDLYTFIYRGILSDESLDKAGRLKRNNFGQKQAVKIKEALSFNLLESDLLSEAERMSLVYIAIHTFENMVRNLVSNAMAEKYHKEWWTKVTEKIRTKVLTRMEEDTKFKWHDSRGGTEIEYCDFGDLSTIIVLHWKEFEDVLGDMDWTKSILSILKRSRNTIMHGGVLAPQDIERIGNNIRDWIRQTG